MQYSLQSCVKCGSLSIQRTFFVPWLHCLRIVCNGSTAIILLHRTGRCAAADREMQRVLADDRAQSKGPVANPCECNGQQSFRFSVNSMYQPTIVQPTGGQPGCCEQRTGLSPSSSGEFVYPIATDASQQLPGCYCPAPATFLVGAVGPDEVLPPDAESCCGDTAVEAEKRLVEISALEQECRLVSQTGREHVAHKPLYSNGQSPSQSSYEHRHKRQRACSTSSSRDSEHCSTGDVMVMGDDFECMGSEDASRLLDDATIDYPGGVDAALADMYAACSNSELVSASAGPLSHATTAYLGQGLNSSRPTAAAGPGPGAYYTHQYHHQQHHGHAIPSLGAVLQTPTPPTHYAPDMLRPCCQWSAFSNDPVGAVLAGREPAAKYLAPRGSCCSSGGLTDCLMKLQPA